MSNATWSVTGVLSDFIDVARHAQPQQPGHRLELPTAKGNVAT
jgi:hypothetical protein